MLEQAEEAAGIGSWDSDIRTGELRWSDNLFRLFGLIPGAFIPTRERAIERVHADDRDRVRQRDETALATGSRETLEFGIGRGDGAVRRLQSVVASVEHGKWRSTPSPRDGAGCHRAPPDRQGNGGAHRNRGGPRRRGASLEDGAERLLARLGEAMAFDVGVLRLRQDDVLIARSSWRCRATERSEFELTTQPLNRGPNQALLLKRGSRVNRSSSSACPTRLPLWAASTPSVQACEARSHSRP